MALPPPSKPGMPGKLGPQQPPANEDAIARAKREKDELAEECKSVEEELEELKARYEQYFLGVERKEPVHWREDVKKKVLRLKTAFTRNTGLRFRLQTLNARYLSYERMWLRSAREKEEGTYHRDLFKARMRAKRDEPRPPEEAPGKAPPAAAQKAAAPAQPAKGAAAAPPAAAAPRGGPAAKPPAGAMSDAQMRQLYNAYVAAKRSCNEDVSRLSYDVVASTVSKQIPELITRYKASSVEFKVEVKEGKAILKAVPKI